MSFQGKGKERHSQNRHNALGIFDFESIILDESSAHTDQSDWRRVCLGLHMDGDQVIT